MALSGNVAIDNCFAWKVLTLILIICSLFQSFQEMIKLTNYELISQVLNK